MSGATTRWQHKIRSPFHTPVMWSEDRKADETPVVTQWGGSDARRSLFLMVAPDKGARQPAVLLLDVEGEQVWEGKKKGIRFICSNRTTPKCSFPLLSLSFIPCSHVCDILCLSSSCISPPNFKFSFLEFTFSFSQTTLKKRNEIRDESEI
jgi:hypothetical protein